jgi:hypothetical protein
MSFLFKSETEVNTALAILEGRWQILGDAQPQTVWISLDNVLNVIN